MDKQTLIQLSVFLLLLLLCAWPMGKWLCAVAEGRFYPFLSLFIKFEKKCYQLAGVDAQKGMLWHQYAIALLSFNLLGTLVVYGIQRLQNYLPLNPQGMLAVSPDSAFNTAVSFVSNTNWQGYSGESTMSYLTQLLALTGQNFFSAATGIAVAFALIRGLAARSLNTIGNFWVDITRITLYILLPLSTIFAIFLVSQGVIQNTNPYRESVLLEKLQYEKPKLDLELRPVLDVSGKPIMEMVNTRQQVLPMGPVASQEAIKMLGTNGGGFFNANSAHPFENPTPLSNFLQMLAIFLIPAGLCFTFGRMVGDMRQGWALIGVMTLIFAVAVAILTTMEQQGNPLLTSLGISQQQTPSQSGGNMEGKETRFGIVSSALFGVVTTAASCGAVNMMHDSLTPIGGLVTLVMIQLGEIIFGGVGSGLYGMLLFVVLTVFISGLMIGRTPEYLGKKIETYEMKMTSIAILITPALVLLGSAIALVFAEGRAGISNPGPHGFSQVLYALSSAANNNGSAFAGLSTNTPFYNVLLGIAMWFGRFAMIVPVLAMAGSLAAKKRLNVSAGTLPTHGPLFMSVLIGTILLVGLLNYIPALALGPIVEHLILWATP